MLGQARLPAVRLLGDLLVDGVDSATPGSRKGRTLLKTLALARGRPVTVDARVDVLWPKRPPDDPVHQVAVLVSRLRGVLGGNRVTRSDPGYSLRVETGPVAVTDRGAPGTERCQP